MVRSYLTTHGIAPSLGAAGRFGSGGPGFILYTARFCADFFAHPYIVAYSALLLGLLGSAYLVIKRNYYLPLMLLLPLCAFLVFGSNARPFDPAGLNDYYSAAYMPFAFILASASWRLLELAGSSGSARR